MADFQPFNLAQIYGAADQANAQKQESQLRQMQIKKLQDADQEDQDVKDAFKSAIQPDGTLNRQTLFASLYQKNPAKALAFQNSFNEQDIAKAKNDREIQTSKLTDAGKTIELMQKSAAGVLANPTLQNAIQTTMNFGKLTGQDISNEINNLQQIGDNPEGIKRWAAGHALTAEQLLPKVQMQDTGGTSNVLNIDPVTGKPTIVASTPKVQSPDSIASNATTIRGQNMTDARERDKLAALSDPASIESMAQMVANGQMPAPTGFAARSPAALAIMRRVAEINPDFSATTFNTNKKASADFATGKTGNSVRSFNVAISHLNTLSSLADALNNGDIQGLNKIGNIYNAQTGQAAPTNFDSAKKIVTDEIVKAIVGAGGGVADREEAAKTISNANSPAQLKGAIATYIDLMNGQLKGLRQQYEVSTGKDDFDKFLSPESKAELVKPPPLNPSLSIKAPNGKTYTFSSPAQLNEFKRQAGL